MINMRCKVCAAMLNPKEGYAYVTCEYCDVTTMLPKGRTQRITDLLNHAIELRQEKVFDRAIGICEEILKDDIHNADALWCIVLCRYGIEYVKDPPTGEFIPTCHRMQPASILTDRDYISALDNAQDDETREYYKTNAEKIDKINKEYFELASREKPYDVFICFKDKIDGTEERTKDSYLAQDIYFELSRDGYRVFFSRLTLREGDEWEPIIYSALNSAKVMLVIGSKPEYFKAPWVVNEWDRYLKLWEKDHQKRKIITCYRDMSIDDLPKDLNSHTPLDMSKIGFIQDLFVDIKKIIDADKVVGVGTATTPESITKYGWQLLEFEEWENAINTFHKALSNDEKYAPAHIGVICAENRLSGLEQLASLETLTDNKRFKKAFELAGPAYRAELQRCLDTLNERNYRHEYSAHSTIRDGNAHIVWKHPHEVIDTGGQLVVYENQEATLFMNGQAVGIFPHGIHTLTIQMKNF